MTRTIVGMLLSAVLLTTVAAQEPVAFAVISIKTIDPAVLSFRKPGTPPLAGMSDIVLVRAGGTFSAPAISARNLIATAFGVKAWQVVGDADWLDSARFEITAKTSLAMSREALIAQAPALIQALLAERFAYKGHHERRPLPVLALTVARQDERLGPRLQRHDIDCDARNPASPPRVPPPAPSMTERRACNLTTWPGGMIGGAVSMDELANALIRAVDAGQAVVNRTNLAGRFDLDLAWAPDALRATDANGPGAGPANDGVSLSTALQEQLGLRLVTRSEPVEAMVIDHIERPSEN